MRRSARGFTLVELMAVVGAAGAFGATITTVSMTVHAEQRTAQGRQSDLDGLRRAARLLESDLRAGFDPASAGWHLEGDVLRRRGLVLVQSVAVFRATRDGDLWHLRLGVKPRAADGPRREAVLDWEVRARVAEGDR